MQRIDRVVVPLRALLILVFVGLLVAEFLSLPGQFFGGDAPNPVLGPLPWVLLVGSIAVAVGMQVVIVCVWRLLTLVASDRIFSHDAFGWVDAIAWALAVAWSIWFAACVFVIGYVYVTPELRDPGVPIVLIGTVLIGAVVVLLVIVLRALLRQAAALRSEMEEVI
ncbi:DUF2975 domain-containing protein [Agromyces sp. ZXT2-6]|uniref:DUF2975 domain-containing protein n=1 Tax=Agromyces sp. ZXT2-6 TaxID=3461153 RepID=UPI0040549FB1